MIEYLYADIGYHSLTKHGEIVCGDHIEKIEKSDGSVVLVLADGLGSGRACRGSGRGTAQGGKGSLPRS